MVSIVIKVQRWENTLGTNWPNVLPTKSSRFEQLWCAADTSRADLRTRIKESPSWWRGTGRSSSDGRRVDRSFAAGSSFHPDSRLPGLGLNQPREEGEDHHGQPHRLRAGSQLHLHVQLRAGNSWRFAFSAAVIPSWKKIGRKVSLWRVWRNDSLPNSDNCVREALARRRQNWSKAENFKKLRNFLGFLRFPVQAFLHLVSHLSAQQLQALLSSESTLSQNQTCLQF